MAVSNLSTTGLFGPHVDRSDEFKRAERRGKLHSVIVPHTITADEIGRLNPSGIILSGGPKSVHEAGAPSLDPAVYELRGFDIWFQADQPRVVSAMTDPDSTWHDRTSVHPLFSLLSSPLMRALTSSGVDPLQAGRGMMAACGFLTAAFLLLALRGLGLPRAAAAFRSASTS